ncbi:RNA methyltransferase [Sphingomonas sp. BK235]|uniref:TrmH family RNA methyltransferase n=1 Tax=Sphingomonas sp. BK235 TaxID=2512131 RepID=UPI00104286AE|nr:RNA methyltransferase [Sphingomonas sp. BK235]TCP33151.1 tRNA G18 (ribose-2'-O)-methylase SpoU [Sphingomonas sp. BK235]
MPALIPIDDPADARIHPYRDVRERDLVGRDGLFVAEGVVVLEKLVTSPLHRPLSLLLAEKRAEPLRPLWSRLGEDVPVYVARQPVLDAIAGFPLHRGVLAIGARAPMPEPAALLATARAAARDVLLLCGIANHDNMGGILRNAAAFGIGAVLLDSDCCDPFYRKAIRVSVGAALDVPQARLAPGADAIALLDRAGFAPVALSPAGSMALADWVPPPRSAVLLGAEGPGLAAALMARTATVRIPMADGFDSLNVATTSGIVLHHLSAARRRGG